MLNTFSQFLKDSGLKNWLPYKLVKESSAPTCEWLYVGEEPFLEPVFDQTINLRKHLPENRDRQEHVTSVSALFEWSQKIEAAEVAVAPQGPKGVAVHARGTLVAMSN